ncbi:MAG: DUF2937 family protein [Psychromonas sp.]|nr:DUF2937 family protein [Psychromonas sp.]
MLASIFKRYTLNVVFVFGLIIGMQLPNFLAQYELRLDAHYIESKNQLLQYQTLASLLFNGDINALIQKHKDSHVAVFKAEVLVIENTLNRFNALQQEKDDLKGSILHKLYFLITKIHTPLFKETSLSYKAEIVLNQDAILMGLVLALFSSVFCELLFFVLTFLKAKKTRLNNA